MTRSARSQLQLAHETGHPLACTFDPLGLQLGIYPWAAVHPSIAVISGLNVFGELTIFSLVLTHRTLPPGVVSAHRHVERLAEQADWIHLSMVFDELKPHGWLREKMATASDKISLKTS
jgi:hypothetical protein